MFIMSSAYEHVYLADRHDSDVVLPTTPPALVIALKDCPCQH